MNFSIVVTCLLTGSAFAQVQVVAPPVNLKPTKPIVSQSTYRNARLQPFGGTLALNGSDSCATPDAIAGSGPFSFDTTAATTGTEGQAEAACNFYGSTPIGSDVWFSWTAGFTGTAVLSLCAGAGFDTKVAVYGGSGCPVSGSALACNDDFCGTQSQLTFACVSGSQYTVQLGGYVYVGGAQTGTGTFTIAQVGVVVNDDCGGAITLSGAGPYAFDNSNATTGVVGQTESACLFYGLTGIDNDVWYTWTAPSSGIANLQLCGGSSMDSKLAVYSGAGCPVAGSAIACNDDSCGLQSAVCFAVVGGQSYTIQLGNYPGATGSAGTFTITVGAPPPPCDPSDGSTENLLGWGTAGEFVWLNKFGGIGQTNTISTVDVAWGSALYPGYNPGNGTNATIAVWKDANDDGDPSDGILLAQFTVVVANVDTDLYNTYTLPVPLTISGVFHVGAGQVQTAGQYVATMDQGCDATPGESWFFGDNTGAAANYANPGANVQPPTTFYAIGYPAVCLIRTNCNAGPMSAYCDPNVGGVIPCPCANPPSGLGRGCDNSSASGGASISGAGTASLSGDTLVFTTSNEQPTATSILLQGDASIPAGVIFGQGIRCVGGNLKRIGVKTAAGGSITYPQGGDLSVSAKSAFVGDPISAGTDRFYMVYYRDPILLGGCILPNTFNGTNAGKVTWAP